MVEGVGRIPGFVNSYTLQVGAETYLIDTGFSRKARSIRRAFENAGVPLSQVSKVLLTHHHLDHMGGAAQLDRALHVPLGCHPDDIAYVEGRQTAPMSLMMRLFVRVHPVPVSLPLQDGDRVGPLVVVHVPGHTPGEVAFYDPTRRILFSGDSVVEHRGRLVVPARRFAANLEQAVGSLDRLRALDVETLLPGHGEPMTRRVGEELEDLIRRAPSEVLRRSPS